MRSDDYWNIRLVTLVTSGPRSKWIITQGKGNTWSLFVLNFSVYNNKHFLVGMKLKAYLPLHTHIIIPMALPIINKMCLQILPELSIFVLSQNKASQSWSVWPCISVMSCLMRHIWLLPSQQQDYTTVTLQWPKYNNLLS